MGVKCTLLKSILFFHTLCHVKQVNMNCNQAFTELQAFSNAFYGSILLHKFDPTDLKCCSLVVVCLLLWWRFFWKHSCSHCHPFSLSHTLFLSVPLFFHMHTHTYAHIQTAACVFQQPTSPQQKQQKVLSGLKEGAVGFVIIPVWAITDS